MNREQQIWEGTQTGQYPNDVTAQELFSLEDQHSNALTEAIRNNKLPSHFTAQDLHAFKLTQGSSMLFTAAANHCVPHSTPAEVFLHTTDAYGRSLLRKVLQNGDLPSTITTMHLTQDVEAGDTAVACCAYTGKLPRDITPTDLLQRPADPSQPNPFEIYFKTLRDIPAKAFTLVGSTLECHIPPALLVAHTDMTCDIARRALTKNPSLTKSLEPWIKAQQTAQQKRAQLIWEGTRTGQYPPHANAIELHALTGPDGNTALLAAITNHHLPPNVNGYQLATCRLPTYDTAMHVAAKHGVFPSHLTQSDIQTSGPKGVTPEEIARQHNHALPALHADKQKINNRTIDAALESGIYPSNTRTTDLLQHHCITDAIQAKFLPSDATCEQLESYAKSTCENVFTTCIENNCYPADITAEFLATHRDLSGTPLLHKTAQTGNYAPGTTIKLLSDTLDESNAHRTPALHVAAETGHLLPGTTIQHLLDSKTAFGVTGLHAAFSSPHPPNVPHEIVMNCRDDKGNTPYHYIQNAALLPAVVTIEEASKIRNSDNVSLLHALASKGLDALPPHITHEQLASSVDKDGSTPIVDLMNYYQNHLTAELPIHFLSPLEIIQIVQYTPNFNNDADKRLPKLAEALQHTTYEELQRSTLPDGKNAAKVLAEIGLYTKNPTTLPAHLFSTTDAQAIAYKNPTAANILWLGKNLAAHIDQQMNKQASQKGRG